MKPYKLRSAFINLPEAADRREYMHRHLSERMMTTTVFQAYSPALVPILGERTQWLCSDTELAALYSHLMAIRNCMVDASHIFIMEDDVELAPGFSAEKILMSAPEDYDILQLGTNCPGELARLIRLGNMTAKKWIRWEPGFWGAFAYIITAKAATKVVERYLSKDLEIIIKDAGRPDTSVADILLYSDCISYTSTFPFATNCAGFKSYIRGEDDPSLQWVAKAREISIEQWKHSQGKA